MLCKYIRDIREAKSERELQHRLADWRRDEAEGFLLLTIHEAKRHQKLVKELK